MVGLLGFFLFGSEFVVLLCGGSGLGDLRVGLCDWWVVCEF